MSMQRLERVDAARADLEEQDRQYNAALDQLEVRRWGRRHECNVLTCCVQMLKQLLVCGRGIWAP